MIHTQFRLHPVDAPNAPTTIEVEVREDGRDRPHRLFLDRQEAAKLRDTLVEAIEKFEAASVPAAASAGEPEPVEVGSRPLTKEEKEAAGKVQG